LNRRLVQKLNEAGLDKEFEISSKSMKRQSVSTLKQDSSMFNEESHPRLLSNIKNAAQIESLTGSKISLPSYKSQGKVNYPKLTQSRISHLLQVCSDSRQLVR
jgi:hypothetical protein